MNNEEHSPLKDFLEEEIDGWDIPIGSNNLPKEPNLDFSSAAEILSKD